MPNLKTHIAYWLIGVLIATILCVGFTSWRGEHDARLIAETKIAASELTVKHLQDDITTITAERDSRIAALEAQRKTVKTPAQAIAAIPDLSTIPLTARVVPDDISRVSVDAMQLFNELNSCRQTEVKLEACTTTASKTTDIVAQKDLEITALRKKPSLWKRFTGTMKAVGIGIGIGAALSHGF